MSVSGVCSICETAPATASCDQCGAQVCRRHYDSATGYCATCHSRDGLR